MAKKKKRPRPNPREVRLANVKAALRHMKGNAKVIGLVLDKLPPRVVGQLADCVEEMQDCCARVLRAMGRLPASTRILLDQPPSTPPPPPPKQVVGCPPPT